VEIPFSNAVAGDPPTKGRSRPLGMDIIPSGARTPPKALGPTAAKPLAGRESETSCTT
jgi:hypothetical protein